MWAEPSVSGIATFNLWRRLVDPQPLFCPKENCPSRGVVGAGNLKPHDSDHNRWKCKVCEQTFSGRAGTPFFGLKSDPQLFVWVVTLLAYGCPPQAIVAAFRLDERTVFDWQRHARASIANGCMRRWFNSRRI